MIPRRNDQVLSYGSNGMTASSDYSLVPIEITIDEALNSNPTLPLPFSNFPDIEDASLLEKFLRDIEDEDSLISNYSDDSSVETNDDDFLNDDYSLNKGTLSKRRIVRPRNSEQAAGDVSSPSDNDSIALQRRRMAPHSPLSVTDDIIIEIEIDVNDIPGQAFSRLQEQVRGTDRSLSSFCDDLPRKCDTDGEKVNREIDHEETCYWEEDIVIPLKR